MVEVMKVMVTSIKRSHTSPATLSAPNPAADHYGPTPPGDAWVPTGKSGTVSCGVTAPFFRVLIHKALLCRSLRVYFPVLCKFWQLYGGVMATSSKRAYGIPKSVAPMASVPVADSYLH